jgi:hypothetical protein
MKSRQALFGCLTVTALALVNGPGTAHGQASSAPGQSRQFETRADLEAQARLAESQHRESEAWLLRSRLEKGDFQEGDRIVVMLHTSAALQKSETLTVRAGKVVQLPQMDDLSLEGVLRSELTDRFVKHLARYLKDPEARTIPLMRVGVLGAVGRSGYYDTSADLLLSDVIMRAGGPSPDADLNSIRIRRGSTVIWGEKDARTALTDGISLDRLHLRAGDEIEIRARRHIPWSSVISIGVGVIGLAFTLIQLRR